MSDFRSHFTSAMWTRLLAHADPLELPAGRVAMRRGEPSRQLLYVESGSFEVRDPRTTPPTVIGLLGPGSLTGEMSFVDGAWVSLDVQAREATTCLSFPTERMNAALKGDVELASAFHSAVAAVVVKRMRDMTSAAVEGTLTGAANTSEVTLTSAGTTASLAHAQEALETLQRRPGQALERITDAGFDPHLASAAVDRVRQPVRWELASKVVRIGSWERCQIVLPDVRIRPIHAEVVLVDSDWWVKSTSERPISVDGRPVRSTPLKEGSVIRLGRYALQLQGYELVEVPQPPTSVLAARGIARRIPQRTLLHPVDLTLLTGELIALVGPSGAGKTTLVNALLGNRDEGTATLDGRPLDDLLADIPHLVGEVPQDDIVLPELTVEEALTSAATLRLHHLTPAQRAERVDRVIESLGLAPIRSSRIGDPEERGISGGQRKRVNIAVELLSDGMRLLFLDEPTSGLDPRTGAELVVLARQLADEGRIVFLVTHDLTPDLMAQVDHLLVMAVGGHLAWFGPVADGRAFFDVSKVSEVFARLPRQPPGDWARDYQATDTARLWGHTRAEHLDALLEPAPAPEPRRSASWLRVCAHLSGRYAKVKARDTGALAVWTVQPMMVALVMGVVFAHPTPGLLFLLTLACFWFGMSASVRELISDRVVFQRERRLGVPPSAWVTAKLAVLSVAVMLQCSGLALMAYLSGSLWNMGFSLPGLVAASTLTGVVGCAMGLAVSSVWRRSEAAVGTIVVLLVPQLAFSGMLMPLDELRVSAWYFAWMTPVRFAFNLVLVQGEKLQYYSNNIRLDDPWQDKPIAGHLYTMGLKITEPLEVSDSAWMLAALLCGWALLAWVVTVRNSQARRAR